MDKINLSYENKSQLQITPQDILRALTLVPPSFMDLAQEYGFERHQRTHSCPVNYADNPLPCPSFLEDYLGDG